MKQNKPIEKNLKMSRTLKRFLIGFVAFGVVVAGVWLIRSKIGRAASEDETGQEVTHIPVVVTRPVQRTFEQIIVTQGNVEAKNVAMVSPRIPGTLEEFFVDEGDSVVVGQTKLFQTDSVKLEQNVTIREHDLAVSRCVQQQAQANLEKVTADFNKAELDFMRFERLLEKEATTQDVFEQQQSRYKQLTAARRLTQAQVELAAEQARQAEAGLVIARKDLADTTVVAPISGKVSMRMAEPGEMGNPEQVVLRIDDTSVIEVAAFLPAQYYSSVIQGQTVMKIQVGDMGLGRHPITYKSPTINPKLRTFEVKCLLENPPEGVVPGVMAQIAVVLEYRKGLGVPSAAIQERAGQSVVFVVRDNVSHQVAVKTGIEAVGWTEICEGELTEDTPVVTMGQYLLNEDSAVTVQKENN